MDLYNKGVKFASFDWAVRHFLRNRVNFDVIEGFLSELLDSQITITNVLEGESNKKDRHSSDKFDRFYMLAEHEWGEIIVIEMQSIMEMDYYGRMLFGASRAIVDRTSEIYRKIKKVYSINILYFDFGQGKDYVYQGKTDFHGLHNHDTLQLSQEQRRIFGTIEVDNIETEYYIVKIENFGNIIRSPIDEWIYFIKNEKIEQGFNAQGMFEALNVLDYTRLSPEDRKSFDRLKDGQSRCRSQLASARDEGEMAARKERAKILVEKDKAIERIDKAIAEKDKAIAEKDKTIEEKDKAIEEKDKAIEEKDKAIERIDKAIEEKRKAIEEIRKVIEEKDKSPEEICKEIEEIRKDIEELLQQNAKLKQSLKIN